LADARSLPHTAGLRRGTATSNFYDPRDNLPKPIKAGIVILAVATPGRVSFEPSEDADSEERACVRGNVEALRTMLALDGVRSRELEELGQAVGAR
jgi:hypothetical protein